MKMRILLITVITALFCSLSIANANSSKVTIQPSQRQQQLQDLFIERAKALSKLADAKKTNNAAQIDIAQNEVDLVAQKTNEIGLIPVQDINFEITPMSSSNSDYVWDYTSVYKDISTGRYIWEAQGEFDSDNDWYSECFCSPYYFWYNLGGDDGFGLASLHKDINILHSEFWTLSSDGVTTTNRSANISTINSRGAGWAWQDKVYAGGLFANSKYDSHRRFGWLEFSFVGGVPTGQTISFQANTAHTWNSTSVNSISIGGGGVGFSWASSGHSWTKPVSKSYTP